MANSSIFDRPGAFLQMGLMLVSSGRGRGAVDLFRQLERERPGDPRLSAMADAIMADGIPDFHRGMLADAPRNAAYARAIEALAPGRRVLDIGTGSGLLAMMAARAGAVTVLACEANPMLAATAADIVAANGLADRVTVVPRHSTKLDCDHDLDGGVDLVISEIVSDDLVGEGMLRALDHAARELAQPDAVFMPAAATVRVALAEVRQPQAAMGIVEGFDLSLLDRHLRSPIRELPASPRIVVRSDPADLFRFAFTPDRSPPLEQESRAGLVSTGGRVNALVQWLRLELAPGIAYENAPGGDPALHWALRCVMLPEPRDTAAGDAITAAGWHDATRLVLWAED
ncbi:MAG: 50S ribosomal protein L11 methyltransferase [Novosphingobium sp.]